MADMTLIRQARAERGLTVEDLAAKAGVAASTVRDMELAHRSPHVTSLAKVCRVLNLDLALAYRDIAEHLNGAEETA